LRNPQTGPQRERSIRFTYGKRVRQTNRTQETVRTGLNFTKGTGAKVGWCLMAGHQKLCKKTVHRPFVGACANVAEKGAYEQVV